MSNNTDSFSGSCPTCGQQYLAEQFDAVLKLLAAAQCPNARASGHEQNWPCQWCDERKRAIERPGRLIHLKLQEKSLKKFKRQRSPHDRA